MIPPFRGCRALVAPAVVALVFTILMAGCATQPQSAVHPAMDVPAGAQSVIPTINHKDVGSVMHLSTAAPKAESSDLRIMSFNLRVPVLLDGVNFWELRKQRVAETIHATDPDLLGTQECLASQADFLKGRLSGYEFFGVGRDDGRQGGEMCAVFYKSARFEKLAGGHFWLSDTPDRPGSRGWGAWFPRMVTWVHLRPRDGSPAFFWFNTHFEAFSSHAREASANFLKRRIASIAGGAPAIVTGDFNADAGEAPHRTLVSGPAADALVDTFRAAHPNPSREEGTFHGFHGGLSGIRIDWILSTPAIQTLAAVIVRNKPDGGYPSDHYPVTATLRLIKPAEHADLR